MCPALAPYGRLLTLPSRSRKDTGDHLFFYDYTEKAGSSKPVTAKPVLILVHGLGDEADSWRHVIPLLGANGHRVIAIDLPGFGRSVVHGRTNLARHAQAIISIIEATASAGLESRTAEGGHTMRPVILAGSSMGGTVIQAAAAKRPDLVAGLIFIDGGLPVTMHSRASFLLSAMPILGSRWYRAFRKDHEAAYKSLFGYYGNFETLPQTDKDFLRERVIARVESNAQEKAYMGSLRSMIWANVAKEKAFAKNLKKFPGKVAILWGEQDHVFHPEAAKPLRKIRPEAVFTIISGAGHLPHQEKPAETAGAMQVFQQKQRN
jgi:pimeloyl-ACP methyl ester carboxylesterase